MSKLAKIGLIAVMSTLLLVAIPVEAQRTKTDMITALSWSPDNKHVAVGSDNGTIYLYDVKSASPIALTGQQDRVLDVACSPDGTRLASGSQDNTIRIWNVTTHTLLETFTNDTYAVYPVIWLPDGSRIISGSVEDTEFSLRVRDPITGNTLLGKNLGAIVQFAWSPDQTKL